MKKKIELDTDREFILLTEKGIVTSRISPAGAMAMLLLAYLEMWDEHCFSIDITVASEKVLELLGRMDSEFDDVGRAIMSLFEKEEDDEDDD